MLDKKALQRSYTDHLERLNLVRHEYDIDQTTGLPKFNSRTGRQEVRQTSLTPLGRLLLRHIGLTA